MNRIKITRLDEFHPGAKSIEETVYDFIDFGKKNGIPTKLSLRAIKLLVDYYYTGEVKSVEKNSLLYRALLNIENCIDTALDDGYPEEWIYRELEKLV